MPTLLHPCIIYITYGDGDRGIVSCASTISLTGIQEETTMSKSQQQLWEQVVNDYYKEANYYLVTEVA